MAKKGEQVAVFRGQMLITEGREAPARLEFTDALLEITSSDEEVGTWTLDEVEIYRLDSFRFQIDLRGEPVVLEPDDPVAFAYEAPRLLAERYKWRKRMRRSTRRSAGRAVAAVKERVAEELAARRAQRPATHDHVWVQQTLGAGLVRRICKVCDQVSLAPDAVGGEPPTSPYRT